MSISLTADCEPPTGRLLWSVRADTLVDITGGVVHLSHPAVGTLSLPLTHWMHDVVHRMSLGPIDLGNSAHLAEDARQWRGHTRQQLHAWPRVQKFLDDLGEFAVPWYARHDGLPPVLGLPAACPDPAPFRLPGLLPGRSLLLVPGVAWLSGTEQATLTGPSCSRTAVFSDPALIAAMRRRTTPAEGPGVLWPVADHLGTGADEISEDVWNDVVRCLAGAGLARWR